MSLDCIGIYAGVGSPLLGARWAGFTPIINHEPRGFFNGETFSHNFPNCQHVEDLQRKTTYPPMLAIGNPSCNVFSNLSTRKDHDVSGEAIRETDFYKAVKLIERYSPSYFVLENIPAITKHLEITKDYLKFNDLKEELHLQGYYISHTILNSIDFGVPQSRRRLFIVGSNSGGPVSITKKRENQGQYYVGETVKEALFTIPDNCPNMRLPNHSQKRTRGFDELEPGESYYGTQNNRRLFLNEPSGVVTSSCSRAVHPTEPRTLTVRETARLMGYPDDFVFFGGVTSQLDQVGKAIVPQVAYSVCLDIRKHISE